MASSFFELSVATTGLFTAKGALNVVSHNIANAATDGYSRQVAVVKARTPLNYQNGKGMIGTGAEIVNVKQIRNTYLDTKYWTHNGVLGEYTAKYAQCQLLQSTLNETEATGFNASLNNLFSTLSSDLGTEAGNTTARLNVISQAQQLCTYFNTTATNLQNQQLDVNQEVKAMVSQINNLGIQIQNLNKQIFQSELDGSVANDLRDERARIVDELSKFVNVEVSEKEVNVDLLKGTSDKQFSVLINGYDFVNHYSVNTLNCVERTAKQNSEDVEGLYDVYWPSGIKFNSEYSMKSMGGELKGLLVTRDGNNQNQAKAEVRGVAPNAAGGYTLTFDNWNREDMPTNGNISFGNKVYAYENFTFDPATNTMSLDIPPSSGKMTIGDKLVGFAELKVTGDQITFRTDSVIQYDQLRGIIRIGDMVLTKGNFSLGADGRTVTLSSSSVANEIGALSGLSAGDPAAFGHTVDYKGIPYLQAKLNTFARGLARSFNLGQDVDGNKLEGVTGHYYAYNLAEEDNTGYNFFTYSTPAGSVIDGKGKEKLDYHNITAGNISVSNELLNNQNLLAAALGENPDISDNQALLELLDLKHNPNIFAEGEFGNYIESVVGELAVVTSEASTFTNTYTDISMAVDQQRLSVSSVSLDEEVSNMILFQQLFNACSKLVSTLNGIYDTMINMV